MLLMHTLSDARSMVAVGEGSIDIWDHRCLAQAVHSVAFTGAPSPLSTVGICQQSYERKACWNGIAGHSLFDPDIYIVGADFDAGDGLVIMLSSGAAIAMDMTKGPPMPRAVIKPHVDLTQLGNQVTSLRRDACAMSRFGVAWGRQGGHSMLYMSDNLSPPPPRGDLGFAGSNAGIYCIFPDNPTFNPPPHKDVPEQGSHWESWWERCNPTFSSPSRWLTSSFNAQRSRLKHLQEQQHNQETVHHGSANKLAIEMTKELLWLRQLESDVLACEAFDVTGGRQLQHVRLLQECTHVPLPPSNSRATLDTVIAIAASESVDLVVVATSNGHLQTASTRRSPPQRAQVHHNPNKSFFCRGTVASCR